MKIDVTLGDIRQLVEMASADAATAAAANAARRSSLPQRLLERYETLLGTGRSPVLVGIEDGCCSACHVRLPTMVAHQARHTAAIYSCPCCRRMLYAPELLGGGRAADACAPSAAPETTSTTAATRRPGRRRKTLAR